MQPEPVDRRRILRAGLLFGAAAAATVGAASLPAFGTHRRQLVDYPGAHWAPADPSNFTIAERPSNHPIDHVVLHVTQTTFANTIGIFQDPAKQVSAHYVVRSVDGRIAQCVREADIAWHAGNWEPNTRSIGIEHEGWVDRPGYFTAALYASSAALTAHLCDTYGIPLDRDHIVGHSEVPGADHTDPGPLWDWDRYLRLVAASPPVDRR